jgi:hypothetical protein
VIYFLNAFATSRRSDIVAKFKFGSSFAISSMQDIIEISSSEEEGEAPSKPEAR